MDFFDPLKTFISNLKLGEAQDEHLVQLERKFCVICILYRKYEKEFFNLFRTTDVLSGYQFSPFSRSSIFSILTIPLECQRVQSTNSFR